MRGSLSILAFFLASIYFGSVVSLPTPYNGGDSNGLALFRRTGKDIKNSVYRKNSAYHPYDYTSGTPQPASGTHVVHSTDDADHLLEAQTVHKALKDAGHPVGSLHPAVLAELKQVFNGPGNVLPIPKSINRSKGQAIKAGLSGNAPSTMKPGVLDHAKATYPIALDNAEKMDDILVKHGVTSSTDKVIQKTHEAASKAAGFHRRR